MRPCGHASKGENIVLKSYVSYKVTCRVLDLIDDISWKLSLEEQAELSVVRLRIDIMNGDRGVAEVTAKNALDQAKAKKWRGVVAAASSVLSSISWHNINNIQ